MNVWECPNGKDFVNRIMEKIDREAANLYICCQGCHGEDLMKMLGQMLEKSRGPYIKMATLDSVIDLMKTLFPGHATLETAIDTNFNWNIGLVWLPRPEQDEWVSFFNTLAKLSKQQMEVNSYLNWFLVGICPAGYPMPQEEVCLDIYDNPDVFGTSDMEYACQKMLATIETRSELPQRLWVYALCKGLATIDPTVCEYLVRTIPRTREDVQELLSTHPWFRLDKATGEAVMHYDINPEAGRNISAYRQLKKSGLLGFDFFGNPVIHPAALLAAKRFASLDKYLWRGQIQVYMPLVQEAHRVIWTCLNRTCGDGWKKPVSEAENIEIDLLCLVKYMFSHLKGRFSLCLGGFADKWRSVRNSLAHGDFLQYEDALQAVKMLQEYRHEI